MSDIDAIQEVIQMYFDCMNESSADKVKQAFHPNAKITGYLPDGFHEMNVDDFLNFARRIENVTEGSEVLNV